MKFFKMAVLAAIVAVTAAAAAAQDEPIKVETNLVTVNASVTDRKGNHIRGLTQGDFALLDSGKSREIEAVYSENAPLSVGIVYDMHAAGSPQSDDVLKALKKLTSDLRTGDDFFVSVFNERGTLTTEFVPDSDQIERHLAGSNGASPNSLYDAIFDASNRTRLLRNSKKILLVLTDGADHASGHSLKALKAHLRSVNLPVYALTFNNSNRREYGYLDVFREGPRRVFGVGESTELDRAAIAEIAKSSGGQAYENKIRNQFYLSGLVRKVLDEVRDQYVIGFYPEDADGRWHSLKVTVKGQKDKRLKVSSRKGYLSPKKAAG